MEVKEQFGIDVHAIVDVRDIHAYLQDAGTYGEVLHNMETYMDQYCLFD